MLFGKSKTVRVRALEGPEPNAIFLRTRWDLVAEEREVADILSDFLNIQNWWGEIFLNLAVLEQSSGSLVGMRGSVHSKGFLPYWFSWIAEAIEHTPEKCVLTARGDFVGTATFRRPLPGETGSFYFDWNVLIEEPRLKPLCPAILFLCHLNHAYALSIGRLRMQEEIHRRRDHQRPIVSGHRA
jgi:hypothetical protein